MYLFFSYPVFTFNIDFHLYFLLHSDLCSFAVLFSPLTMLLPLAKYIVERDRVSNQEIVLVSSKLSAPEKIEVALIKKRGKNEREKPWALLEGSLSSRRLCTCHPDSIPTFFSRKRTANKNPLWRDISQETLHRATLTDFKQNLCGTRIFVCGCILYLHTAMSLYVFL